MDERDPIWDEKEWAEIRASLQSNGEATYLCLARALDDGSNGYEATQRLDLTLDQVARFLEPEGQLRFNDSRSSLVDGAIAWLRARTLNNCVGRSGGAYRVVLYKQGGQRLDTLRFGVQFEQGARPSAPPAPAGPVQLDEAWSKIAGATAFLGSAYHDLGRSYASHSAYISSATQRLLNHFDEIQAAFTRMMRLMYEENATLRGAHNELLRTHHEKMQEVYGELMAFRVEFARLKSEGEIQVVAASTEAEVEKQRMKLAENLGDSFFKGLSTLGEVWVQTQTGLHPRVAALVRWVQADPELIPLLQQPEVEALASEENFPGWVDGLKELLRAPRFLTRLRGWMPRLRGLFQKVSGDEELMGLLDQPALSRLRPEAALPLAKSLLADPELLEILMHPTLPAALQNPEVSATLKQSLKALVAAQAAAGPSAAPSA